MGLPKPPLKGSCLCGAVQVTVTAPPLLTVACHCNDCQKFTASAFSMTTMVPKDAFVSSGELITGGLGTPGRKHFYCASCLTFVYSEIEGAGRINLRTSILDKAAEFPPFVEVMTDQKLPWAEVPVAHSFAGAPANLEELQALMRAYSET